MDLYKWKCNGYFYMSSWLGHSTQIFDQTLFYMFLWKYFLDVVFHGLFYFWLFWVFVAAQQFSSFSKRGVLFVAIMVFSL